MLDILHKLEDMETGEIDMVEGPSGYHIIMKYRLDSGKFGDVNYAEWFASFNTSLMNELFLDKCEQFYDDIKLNENNFDKARSIKEIGINFHY